jgi:hypothetical protein
VQLYQGKLLKDDQTLDYYGLTDGKTIHLAGGSGQPIDVATSSGASSPALYCCIISLKEAETLFRAASNERAGAKLRHAAGALPPLALRTLEGMWLSAPMSDDVPASSVEQVAACDMKAMLQCARFFDNTMQFTENEQISVLESIKTTSPVDRCTSFQEVIGCRKRDSSSWEGKGVSAIFQYSDAVHLTRIRDLSSRVRSKLVGMGTTTAGVFSAFDEDNTNWLSLEKFQIALSKLDLDLPAEDVAELLQHADRDNDGFLSFRDFAAYFAVQSESTTDDKLAIRRRRRLIAQKKAAKQKAEQENSVSGLEALETLARVEASADDRARKASIMVGTKHISGAFDQSRLELVGSHFVYGDGSVSFHSEGRASAGIGQCVSTSPRGTKLQAGKYYFEVTLRTHAGDVFIGLANESFGVFTRESKCGNDVHSLGFDASNGIILHGGVQIPSKGFPSPCRAGDTIGCYIDMDAHTVAFTRNSSRRSGLCIECAFDSHSFDSTAVIPVVTFDSNSYIQLNFGESRFVHTPTVDGRDAGFRSIRHWQREMIESRHISEEQYRFAKLEGSSGQLDMKITHNADGTVTAANTGDGFPSAVLGGVILTQGVWYWEFTITDWPGNGYSKLFQCGWGDIKFSGDAKVSSGFKCNQCRYL